MRNRYILLIGALIVVAVSASFAAIESPIITIQAKMYDSTTVPADAPDSSPESVTFESIVPDADDLLNRLRSGGLIIVIRHAATDRSQPDHDPVDLNDCSTQRNLTDAGRADARAIGEAFRELQLPVGTIWTSPYCRARETADLAFGRAEVIDGLERLYPVPDEAAESRINRRILELAPQLGDQNMVIAGHGVYPSVLAPAVAIGEGEAAIYALHGEVFVLLARMLPDEWIHLAPDAMSINEVSNWSDVVERALDSVVSVEVREGQHSGSGFRVAVAGMIVTNAHILAEADEVFVVLRDGTRRAASVVGRAPDIDIAVLELDDDSGLPPMHSGSGLANLKVGDQVLAVGYPLGGPENVTSGILSALDKRVLLGNAELEVLQTDIAVNHNYSGGPLVNLQGQVLGVITAIATPRDEDNSTRVVFAIPVDIAKKVALEIMRNR